jgi:hypothetical protein
VHGRDALRIVHPLIAEQADLAFGLGLGAAIPGAAHGLHAEGREVLEQLPTQPSAADLARAVLAEVAVQRRAGNGAQRRDRRKAVDHRHIPEDAPHALQAAFTHIRTQRQQPPLGGRAGAALAHQLSHELGRRAVQRSRVERVAAVEVNLLQLREQRRAGLAARQALQVGHRQVILRLLAVREEDTAAVIVPRDHQHVAGDGRTAGRGQPIGAAWLDELQPAKTLGRQMARKGGLLVRRVDRQGADGLQGCGVRGVGREQAADQQQPRAGRSGGQVAPGLSGGGHGSILALGRRPGSPVGVGSGRRWGQTRAPACLQGPPGRRQPACGRNSPEGRPFGGLRAPVRGAAVRPAPASAVRAAARAAGQPRRPRGPLGGGRACAPARPG